MTTSDAASQTGAVGSAIRRFVAAPVRPETYRNLAYLALAFPLGIGYFVAFVTGGALGVGLLITVIGLPILLLTVAAATAVASFEAFLATRLVGVEASPPAFVREFEVGEAVVLPGNGFVAALKRLLTAPSTWTSVVLVLSKFAFGIASFVALVSTAAIGVALLAAPLVYDDPSTSIGLAGESSVGGYTVGPWIVDTLPEALVVAAGGVCFLFVAINALNLLARLQAEYTARILRVGEGPA